MEQNPPLGAPMRRANARRPLGPRAVSTATVLGFAGFVLLSVFLGALVGAAGLATAAAPAKPLTGSITGPSYLGPSGHSLYTIHGSGGSAEAANGTQVGIYSFHANLSSTNVSGSSVTPTRGVLSNGTGQVTVLAPNITETVVLTVQLNSSYAGQNESVTFTYTISVVQPYRLKATLQVVGPAGISGFVLTVNLDGQPVGTVAVPSLTAGASYPLTYAYVTPGLPAGWHTFSINLAPEHGLVVFADGSSQYLTNFYVTGPPPDNTVYYVLGAVAFIGAILILVLRVGSRARARSRK